MFHFDRITIRRTIKRIGVAALIFCGLSACDTATNSTSGGPALPPSPNIVWLVAEDLSPIIPPFGDNTVSTPNISRLADEGIRFTNAFSTSGVCAPSRAALATGMYQNGIGALHMRTTNVSGYGVEGLVPYEAVPPPEVKMLSQYFREAGYYTTNNAKEDYQFRKALTAWDDSSNSAHWRNRSPNQPFFAVFNFGITHESQVWAQASNPLLINSNLDVPIPPYLPDTEIAQQDIRQVYSNIVAMDQQVGEIINQLEEDGLLENTVIFWYTDHGGPLPRQKRLLYDSGLQIPLVVRFPDGWRAGETDDQLVSFVDFKSTALSLAGIEPPDYVDGQAFLGEFTSSPRQYIHAAADRFDTAYDTIRAVRDQRYKYLRNFNPDQPYYLPLTYREQMPIMQELLRLNRQGALDEFQAQWFRLNKAEEELFDTATDPHELVNLAADPAYREKLEELRSEMTRWMDEINDQGLIPEPELIESMWPGLNQPVTATPVAELRYGRVVLNSDTVGAQIGYQLLGPDDPYNMVNWQVYTGPVTVAENQRLVAIAHRIGFQPSGMVEVVTDTN